METLHYIFAFNRLISASVGTVVYYGFQCHPNLGRVFLSLCFATGLAGNIFPFMDWFNQREYRVHRLRCYFPARLTEPSAQSFRVAFFLTMAFSAVGPLAALSMTYSRKEMLAYIGPYILKPTHRHVV